MTTTYVLKNLVSDLGGGDEFNLILRQNTAGPASTVVSVDSLATQDGYGFSVAGDPSTLGSTGTYTVVVNVTAGNTRLQLSIGLQRINNSGVVQQTSAFSLEQTASAGVKTFNFPSTNLGTWAAGDRLRVTYRFRNTFTMLQSCTIELNTANSAVVAPWTMPLVGDDYIFTDVCGFVASTYDVSFIHKWTDVGSQVWGSQLNTTDQTNLSANWYGINKFQRGYQNNNRLYYIYTPWKGGSASIVQTQEIGWIDTNTGVKTILTTINTQLGSLCYVCEFFGVDRNDNIVYMTNIVDPPVGQTGWWYRLLRFNSAGAIINDTKIKRPQAGPFNAADYGWAPCVGTGTTFECTVLELNAIRWLSDDGQYIYGFGEVLPSSPKQVGAPCEAGSTFGCWGYGEQASTQWSVFRIDVASGAITYPISTFTPLDLSDGIPVNTGIMSGQPLRLLDGSVWVFPHIVWNGPANSYIGGYHFTSAGTLIEKTKFYGLSFWIDTFHICPIWAFAADIDSLGQNIWCRLNFDSDSPTSPTLQGQAVIFSTPAPLSSSSVFNTAFTAYLLSYAECHWGQIQINTATRPLSGGLYTEIDDIAQLQATLAAGPPPTAHKHPFVTLIGAN